MSYVKARECLKKYGLEERIIEFPISTATVKLAAEALGTTEGEIAKSMAFHINDETILIISAGDKRIDNSKYKQYFKVKAKMVPFEEVESVIGHAAGGVCPFGINENVKVYLDESLKKYKYVYPACGTHNTAVKLSIEDLEKASNYDAWIDVCKE